MQSLKKNWVLAQKMTWEIWWFLLRGVASLKIYTLVYCFIESILCLTQKKYRGPMSHNFEQWCKIWRGTDFCFEKWHEEFGEFWPNTWESQNLHFNGLLLAKVYNIWAKRLQWSYASLYWRSMQILKEKWLVVS